jgi:uncharacterized protein (TIGR03437 family)
VIFMRRYLLIMLVLAAAVTGFGQTPDYPYVFKQFAGAFPLGDGGPATQALLYNPLATQLDSAGNVYILDQSNFRIRKVAANGTITTFAELKLGGLPLAAFDMKRGADGSLYVSTSGRILKISSAGTIGVLAGTSVAGTSPDGTSAAQANLSLRLSGLALDSAGLVYFVEDSRVRRIKSDGTLETVAGTATAGYGGDKGPATSALLNSPVGIALDASNNLYIADYLNSRIRKVTGGTIATIAGTGIVAAPTAGPAAASAIGNPTGLTVDSSGSLLIVDSTFFLIYKISGTDLSLLAGSGTFSYADGPELGTYLYGPVGITADSSGNLYVTEKTSHRVRKIAGSATSTFAGRLHFAGDGGPAAAAILNGPVDVALDPQGIAAVIDSGNFRVRRVAANGVIDTIAGNGIPVLPTNGAQAAASSLPGVAAATYDSQGNLYLAVADPALFGSRILRVDAAGVITRFAGNGTYANSGNGGLATAASFQYITGMAADLSGNLYVADSAAHVVRRITPAGVLNAFAGTGAAGFSGENGPATAAALNLTGGAPLAVDHNGNLFIGDGGNNRVRRVDLSGTITTYAGNGTAGLSTDGAQAASSPLYAAAGLATDSAGNLYIAPRFGGVWWRVNPAGAIHYISGVGSDPVTDGAPANSTFGFAAAGIHADSNGDLYVTDQIGNTVWKLVLNSPAGLVIVSGNNQTGASGADLPQPLRVQVNGRAGVPVAGSTVNYVVTSGAATLSAGSSQTDESGAAAVSVKLGVAGPVVITATVAGTSLSVPFNLTSSGGGSGTCTLGNPVIASIGSLTDFGSLGTFNSGSWLEIKGTNLATGARLWEGKDFQGSNAPTSLDGTSVTIDGKPAFVYYISGTQVNVQAPADAATGSVPVAVTNCAGTSASVAAQKAALAAGILAPASFNVAGKQYAVAQFADLVFVGNPNLIAGAAFRPAKPGDSIVIYGIGFGEVTPPSAPGVIVAEQNSIDGLTIAFGNTPATFTYGGLSPGVVGLFQFDVVVPDVPDGDSQIHFSVRGTAISQTLYLTVKR